MKKLWIMFKNKTKRAEKKWQINQSYTSSKSRRKTRNWGGRTYWKMWQEFCAEKLSAHRDTHTHTHTGAMASIWHKEKINIIFYKYVWVAIARRGSTVKFSAEKTPSRQLTTFSGSRSLSALLSVSCSFSLLLQHICLICRALKFVWPHSSCSCCSAFSDHLQFNILRSSWIMFSRVLPSPFSVR